MTTPATCKPDCLRWGPPPLAKQEWGVEVDRRRRWGDPQARRSAAPPTAPCTGVSSSEVADGVDAGPPARMEALAGRARAGVGQEAGAAGRGGRGPAWPHAAPPESRRTPGANARFL